jgi:two-component system, OmpR family, sensor histidine kinase VicK
LQGNDEVRHLDGVKGNFGIADRKQFQVHALSQGEHPPSQAIYSNVKGIVDAQQFLFDSLWDKAIPAAERIKEIEEETTTQTITDPDAIQKRYVELIKSVTTELLLIIPTINALYRQRAIGIFQLLKETTIKHRDIKIRILIPEHIPLMSVKDIRNSPSDDDNDGDSIGFRNITRDMGASFNIAIVDGRESMTSEINNDLAVTFKEASGSPTYSNSRSTVLSYISIFEKLWLQAGLYKKHQKMKSGIDPTQKMKEVEKQTTAKQL